MQESRIDNSEELFIALREKWGQLILPYTTVNIPKGWQKLVERLLEELSILQGKKVINSITASWGSVEMDICIVRRSGKEYIPYELMEKYRQESHHCCYECGEAGSRSLINGKLYVTCRACKPVLESGNEGNRTGTWLDEV